MGRGKLKRRARVGQGPEGKRYYKSITIAVGMPPGIDEVPPVGLENVPLLRTPPTRLPRLPRGGITHAAHIVEGERER